MVEILWDHALKFLENYSEGQNSLDELYDFEDETGLLDRHKQLFREEPSDESCLSRELDIKIMFYELVKMICEFQTRRNGCLRQIHKIDGFQDLTNKLFLYKIRSINLRTEDMDSNLPKMERSESTFNLEQRLTALEQSNQALGQKVINLECENRNLTAALKSIQLERNHKVEKFNEEELTELLTRLDKDKNCLTQRGQELNDDHKSKKCAGQMISENHMVFVEQLQKGSENNKIENKEQKEIIMKVNQLEQADVYLQETTKQVMEKLTSLESILRISTQGHDHTKSELLMLKDSLRSMNTEEKLIQNKSALHKSELFAKSDKDLNNQQTPLQQSKKFQMSLQEISTTNFSDTKSVTYLGSKKENEDHLDIKIDEKQEKNPSKLSLWIKKRKKCPRCISKQPSVVNLDKYEGYSLVQR